MLLISALASDTLPLITRWGEEEGGACLVLSSGGGGGGGQRLVRRLLYWSQSCFVLSFLSSVRVS